MTAWTDTVKNTFKEGRLSNPSYQFKDALKQKQKRLPKKQQKRSVKWLEKQKRR